MILSEWGISGVEALRGQAAVLVIVDVLSFSTAVDVAVSKGAIVHPFPYGDEVAAQVAADRVGGVLAEPRRSSGNQFSLSPQSLLALPPGTHIVLPSPNGARLSLACGSMPVHCRLSAKRRHSREGSTATSQWRPGGRGPGRGALAGWKLSASHRRPAGCRRNHSPSWSALFTRSGGRSKCVS